MSHIGRDLHAHVKCKGKQSLLWNDNHVERFVHKKQFQPLLACDIANGIESKCQKEDGTCASTESQARVLPVGLTVKNGNKEVRGKEANSSKNSNFDVNVEYLESAKSSDSSITSGSSAFNVANTV